jgi:hypothetical protein
MRGGSVRVPVRWSCRAPPVLGDRMQIAGRRVEMYPVRGLVRAMGLSGVQPVRWKV